MKVTLDCEEKFEVSETYDGLEVYQDDKFMCNLCGYTFNDFHDEWCKLDENELADAIRDEIELERSK